MKKLGAVLSLAAGFALIGATPAMADGFRSYRVCGGTIFQTCASVEINVVGSNVTMRVWNLSGNSAATGVNTPGNTVFNSIGFYNVPSGVQAVIGSLAMSGPARPGDTPGQWNTANNGKVAFSVDYLVTSGNNSNATDAIASGCAAPGSLPSGPDLYLNPCSDPSSNPAGYVTFNFQITGGSWDPNNSDIVIRGLDPNTLRRTECYTGATPSGRPANCLPVSAVPEPVTMTLLATGLASMGGAGFFRRRRNKNEVV